MENDPPVLNMDEMQGHPYNQIQISATSGEGEEL
jgi:hypothetical protein